MSRMRTLERKKSSAGRLNGHATAAHQQQVHHAHAPPPAKNEFDDLISALRTGDVFAGENMDKFRRNNRHGSKHGANGGNGFRSSPPRCGK